MSISEADAMRVAQEYIANLKTTTGELPYPGTTQSYVRFKLGDFTERKLKVKYGQIQSLACKELTEPTPTTKG